MRSRHVTPARIRTRAIITVVLALAFAALVGAREAAAHFRPAVPVSPALEASIFSYDGSDFVRTRTTLMTEAGASAANTKLDRASPAFKALAQKHSFSGEVTVYGKRYDGNYAPLMDGTGKLTGALFVGVPK